MTASAKGYSAKLLQARALSLELTVSKLALASTHDLSVISSRLRERIKHLGIRHERKFTNTPFFPTYICCEDTKLDIFASRPLASVTAAEDHPHREVMYMIDSTVARQTLGSFPWAKGEEIPLSMSLYFIGLLLPYRSHFHFFIPTPYLLHGLSLPPSDPASIHPCLRNACHLAACSMIGGQWTSLEPYFAARTRQFLEEALMLPTHEHVIHFLWASTLLASYFMRARRVQESFAVVSAACSLSVACGLLPVHSRNHEIGHQAGNQFMLPAPTTEAEALNRLWLAHSLFLTDWSLSALTGLPPSYVAREEWEPSFKDNKLEYPAFKSPMVREEELAKIWQSDIHRSMWSLFIFRKIAMIALGLDSACLISVLFSFPERSSLGSASFIVKPSVPAKSCTPALKDFVRFHDSAIPQLSTEINNVNSDILLSYAALYGSSLVLSSLDAGSDAKARAEMLRCAQKLVDMCNELRGHQYLRIVQSSLVPMLHMMNAVRILAHELRRSSAQDNTALSSEYCHSIEVLLDFFDGMTALFPAWTDSPGVLKDTLSAAMDALRI